MDNRHDDVPSSAIGIIGVVTVVLWLIMVLMSAPAKAERLIVIGDSISAGPDSWPSFIDGYHVHLLAQGGRKAREYDLPRDIRPTNGHNKAVYFLSTGDILNYAKAKTTEEYVRDHISTLTERGFKVVLVLPPLFNVPQFDQGNREHRKMLRRITGVTHCELAWVWDSTQTWDKIHPTPILSEVLGRTIQDCIASA